MLSSLKSYRWLPWYDQFLNMGGQMVLFLRQVIPFKKKSVASIKVNQWKRIIKDVLMTNDEAVQYQYFRQVS